MTAALTDQPNQPTKPRALPSLTGMRWAAAFLVFGTHVRIFGYFDGTAARVVRTCLRPGSTGVSFFFILSGFVLAWTARPRDTAPAFWRRRFARVYPLHLVTALLVLALAWTILPRGARPGPFAFVTNLLLVQSWSGAHSVYQSLNTVSWSLACEAFFYALFPLLWWGIRRLRAGTSIALAVGCELVVIALPVVFGEQTFGAPMDFLPLARLPEFVLGLALARFLQLRRSRGPGMAPALTVLLAGYFLTDHVPHPYRYAACTVVGFALLIVAGAAADLHAKPSLWRHPTMVRLGEISYAFYMVHLIVMRLAEVWVGPLPRLSVGPAILLSATTFVLALTVAWLAHTAVEVPGQQLVLGKRPIRVAPEPERQLVS